MASGAMVGLINRFPNLDNSKSDQAQSRAVTTPTVDVDGADSAAECWTKLEDRRSKCLSAWHCLLAKLES